MRKRIKIFIIVKMQIPKRKPGQFSRVKQDPHITEDKFGKLENELRKLQKFSLPRAAEEVQTLAQMGDFSENAAYQMAKGRLRGINQRILELEDQLNHAVIIKPGKNAAMVSLGCAVTLEISGKEKTYLILGSAETDPQKGVISQNSPLGSALMGKKTGDKIKLTDKGTEYKIMKIA